MSDRPLFPELRLPDDLVADLRRSNPQWEDRPGPRLPATRRHLVGQIHARLARGLAKIVVVRGPRQIGKTTAQRQVLADLLARGVPGRHVLRVQADDLAALARLEEPILRIVDWFEASIVGRTLNAVAAAGGETYLFFDEVQNLDRWAPQLKFLVDHTDTRVVVTGSSALRIELGRDSLAGRITTIEAGVLSLTEIGAFRGTDLGAPFLADNGLQPLIRQEFWSELREHGRRLGAARDGTFRRFSRLGGYPLAHQEGDVPWEQLADQLNENVIERVIQHDLRLGDRGRKRDPALLHELFRIACRYVGQAPKLDTLTREVNRVLGGKISQQRVRNYLRFLGGALLLRLVEPLESRLKKPRGGPKLCLADHGLRASWLQEIVPIAPQDLDEAPHQADLAGHVAESVLGATLCTIPNLDVAWQPERPGVPEIDFVLTIGTRRIPVEVKYQRRIDGMRDTEGLRSFLETTVNEAPFGVLVVRGDEARVADPRIVTVPLSSLMLLR